MPLNKDLRAFVELLNSNGVEYVIVGAFALAWHGYPRYTGDLDVLVRPGVTNGERLMRVLREFGFGEIGISADDFAVEGSVIQLGFPPNRIDLLTGISGVAFDEVWEHRETGTVDGLAVPLIGRRELIRNKQSTGRARDLGDVEELSKRPPKTR